MHKKLHTELSLVLIGKNTRLVFSRLRAYSPALKRKSHCTDEGTKSQTGMAKASPPSQKTCLRTVAQELPAKAPSSPGVATIPATLSITFATQAVLEPVQILLCSNPLQNANWGSPEEYAGSPRTGPGDTVTGHNAKSKHRAVEGSSLGGIRVSLDRC